MKKNALLYEPLDDGRIHCCLCAHECRIGPDQFGICGVRQNKKGKLYTLVYGEPIAAHLDPIEKKPLYHFLPQSRSYSIATIGCNFRCGFCQNWQISQMNKRDHRADGIPAVSPEEIVAQAVDYQAKSISYTYTEPTIFFEYAYDIARLAHDHKLANIFVTNGYMTPAALKKIRTPLDAANVDLKSFRDDFYKNTCGARLEPVLETIRQMHRMNIWLEITTLVIPGLNDSDEELRQIAGFIAGVDVNIPWHISRFHPDHHLTTSGTTPLETLERAKKIGTDEGLRYVYLGNVPAGTDTFCPECGALLIKRDSMHTHALYLDKDTCPQCHAVIAGRWGKHR